MNICTSNYLIFILILDITNVFLYNKCVFLYELKIFLAIINYYYSIVRIIYLPDLIVRGYPDGLAWPPHWQWQWP